MNVNAWGMVRTFKKNCPHVRLIVEEEVELARLFTVAIEDAERFGREEQAARTEEILTAKVGATAALLVKRKPRNYKCRYCDVNFPSPSLRHPHEVEHNKGLR